MSDSTTLAPPVCSLRNWSLWAFPVVFATALHLLIGLPENLARASQDATGALVVAVSHLLGLSASYDPTTHYFDVAGFRMHLVFECTAFVYLALLTLMILCAPQRSLKVKGKGIAFGLLTLILVNIARLIGLGLLGTSSPETFAFLHDYVWKVAFAILTVGLWIVWFERGERISRYLVWGMATLSCGFGAAAILAIIRVPLLSLLTNLADKLLLLVYSPMKWEQRLWAIQQKDHVIIRVVHDQVAYHFPQQEHIINLWQDVFSLALFVGLFGGAALMALLARRWQDARRATTFLTLGALLMLALQVVAYAVFGYLMVKDPSFTQCKIFLWAESSIVLGLPVFLAVWLVGRQEDCFCHTRQ